MEVKIENKLLVSKIKELNSQLEKYLNDFNFVLENQTLMYKRATRCEQPSLADQLFVLDMSIQTAKKTLKR
jgi:hypothetical protein